MTKKIHTHLICLSEEFLLGLHHDVQLGYLARRLADFGITTDLCTILHPASPQLIPILQKAWEESDLVFLLTHSNPALDEVLLETLSKILALPLEYDPNLESILKPQLHHLSHKKHKNNLCLKPKDFVTYYNPEGTMPGFFYHKKNKYLVVFPWAKEELFPLLEKHVLPRLSELGLTSANEPYLQLRTYGLSQEAIYDRIAPFLKDYSEIGLSFGHNEGIIDIRLTPGKTHLSSAEIRNIGMHCAEALDDNFICFGHASMAEVILNQLKTMKKTLSIAESCTGGLLSYAFTQIPGASEVFKGSLVAYTNEVKEELLSIPLDIIKQHDAVSEEIALAMATSAAECFTTPYALSITGYAGPQGGAEDIPVGTVYIGYYCPTGVWAKHFFSPGERTTVQRRAVNEALDFMRRKLNEYKVADFLVTLME